MYINEAIRRADAIAPNEYTIQEKYAWCDELGAMIRNEYLKKYIACDILPDSQGEYLLPEGVTFEMIDKIIANGRKINKYDFRSYGIMPVYGLRRQLYIPEKSFPRGMIKIICLAPYEPIRTARAENVTLIKSHYYHLFPDDVDNADTTDEACHMILRDCDFQAGDSVRVLKGDTELTAGINDIRVLTDGTKDVYFDTVLLEDGEDGTGYTVERIVTDETECKPPYDELYVDFINAKIAYHQRNYTVYNQIMNVFNQRLRAFHNWLMGRSVETKESKMINWW